jgi:hypothetical protein
MKYTTPMCALACVLMFVQIVSLLWLAHWLGETRAAIPCILLSVYVMANYAFKKTFLTWKEGKEVAEGPDA